MWEGGGHWELLEASASLEVMETVIWLYLTTEVSGGFPLGWPFSLWCVTSTSWGDSPPFALSLPWGGSSLPWRRCRCRRGARTGTSGRRAGT